jgi:RecA/RadA recombinase
MGLKAKLKNDFIKSMMIPSIKTNMALVVINHVYDNPGAMYASKTKEQPGGKGLQFASHIIVQSSKSLARDKEEGLDEGQSYFKANEITYFTTKNRLVKLGYEAKMMIDLNHGIGKWDGLLDEARRYDFIQGGGAGRYQVPSYSDKSLTMKEIMGNDEVWTSFLNAFNERSRKDMQYGSEIEAVLANKPLEDGLDIDLPIEAEIQPEVPLKGKASKKG